MRSKLVLGLVGLLSLAVSVSAAAQGGTVEFHQWATDAVASSQYGEDGWSAMQTTGAPNTQSCGDSGTAWASAESTEAATLTVTFEIPVTPQQVNIYETYNPGAITKIELVRSDGNGVVSVPNSADPGNLPCPGVLSINIPQDVPLVNGVIIYLDQSTTGDWNEIDAVELVGEASLGSSVSMWADYAEAGTQAGGDSWSASQAIGVPNSPDCADSEMAWESASESGTDQLTVFFPYLVIPSQLDIYQNYNPGAIVSVDLLAPDGTLVSIPDSADPGTSCPGKMSLKIDTKSMAMGAVIHLDQSKTGNLSEIDAVQITGALADDGLVRQWATGADATSQYGEDSWSAMQATGAPNTFGCGDIDTAWASADSSGVDALTLTYDQPVIPVSVNIYQTYNPGSITAVDLVPADGSDPISVSPPQDASAAYCPGILMVSVPANTPPVSSVIVHVDQSTSGVWNEIDAVRLIGKRVSGQ